jgi:regulator of cell morphogenesis and NO signaling
MSIIQADTTVGEIVTKLPALSRLFEKADIDYCCGGGKLLSQACEEKGLDTAAFIAELERATNTADPEIDVASLSLTALVDHIVQTHHVYLRSELPRLDAMTEKVATVHGDKDARLAQVREAFLALADELGSHMLKEEQVLFPIVERIDAGESSPQDRAFIAGPIRQMEAEHESAGSALRSLRELTDGYKPAQWACNTMRATLEGLEHLEYDLHQHIHKENNVLFPRTFEAAGA